MKQLLISTEISEQVKVKIITVNFNRARVAN